MKIGDVVSWKVDYQDLVNQNPEVKASDLCIGLVIEIKKEDHRDFAFVYWGPGRNGWSPQDSLKVL